MCMTNTNKRVQKTTRKGQIPLPNIHLNNGKYQYNRQNPLTFSNMSTISHINCQVYADKANQSM